MAIVPYEDRPERERRSFPVVVVAVVVLNVLVFLYQLTLSPQALILFVQAWGLTPLEITTGQDFPPTIPLPVYVTLLTSMFIHGGFFHLLINMVFFWVFGDNVEDALGHLTYLLYYLAAGIVGGLAYAFLFPDSTIPAIGASGAVSGTLAGYLILFPRAEVRTLLVFGPFFTVGRIAALILIGIWFLLQLAQGIAALGVPMATGGVAYSAHVAGFLTGAILMLIIRGVRRQRLGNVEGAIWVGQFFRNWILLLLIIGALYSFTYLLAGAGYPLAAAILRQIIVFTALIVALIDGWRRIRGQPSLLGTGSGLGRLLAFVQVAVVLITLITLLTAVLGFA